MTSQPEDPSSGLPPMPVTELTMEQDFHIRRLEDLLPKASKEDIITVFMALQRQNYALANTVKNLLAKWPHYYRRGTMEPWDFIRDQGLSFHLGNAIKYICRAGHKDSYRMT